jgi:hypothetical protein
MEIYKDLSSNYINLKKILDNLLNIWFTSSNTKLGEHTLAYLLTHIPPASFFVYSSYEIVVEKMVKCTTRDITAAKKIIKLNPNIDIPSLVIKELFDKDDMDDIIEGIKLGFARYALFATDKLASYLIQDEEEEHEKGNYLSLLYLERIDYILRKLKPLFENDTVPVDENDASLKVLNNVYKELNLVDILERTNEYIKYLKGLKETL